MGEKRRFTFLVGNGLSIAYNEALSVPALRKDLLAEFSSLSGGPAEEALAAFADHLTGKGTTSFETLLGPLENSAAALPYLKSLATLGAATKSEIQTAISQTAAFLTDLHRVGLSVTLKLIAERAQGQENALDEVIKRTCKAILDLDARVPRCVATLNYDGLLHAGFLDFLDQVPDLAAGYGMTVWAIGDAQLEAHELRRTTDLPDQAKVQVLNLHGSLGWAIDSKTEIGLKFAIDDLRESGYWDLLRNGQIDLWPLVVLTDQKTKRVSTWPFALAYGAFERSLTRSERWMIGGYSFSDVPVNQVLRDAYNARKDWKVKKPTVELPELLVITTDPDTSAVATRVSDVIGCPVENVAVDPHGFPNAVGADLWSKWSA